jgi:Glycosyl hydrolase family 79 C-terminal beta domain
VPAGVIAAVLASILLFALPDHDGVRTAAARARPVMLAHAQVRITSRGSMREVPRSFLGLSTEYWELPLLARRVAPFERVLSFLHVRGDGPLVLRIGGDSADRTFWDPRARRMPEWVLELTPAWLRGTGIVVRRAGVRLILDLNLITGSPLTAARWAAAAQGGLPRGSIMGFEIGNEPDIYSRRYWLAALSGMGLGANLLPGAFSAGRYVQDFGSYAQALARIAPGVPLIGPAVARPALGMGWIRSLLTGAHPGLGTVSAHRYPFSGCAKRRSPGYPTIARVLSEHASAGMAHSLRAAVEVAHRADLPFRVTELNSVTCGGRPGVSDTFATALWAPDALFELLRTGVDAVNVHVRTNAINAAFTPTRHGLQPRPLLYGLILFARTLGPDAQLVDLQVHAERPLRLKVWAVRLRGGVLHVLLINKSDHPASVDLRLPATGPATVERLLAPSVRTTSGVTLDGQELGPDGRWHGRAANRTISPDEDGYELTVPGASAALLGVHLHPGALELNRPRRG